MVSVELPALVRTKVSEVKVPRVVSPKLRLPGVAVRVGEPVPERLMTVLELSEAVIVIVADRSPTALGWKKTSMRH